MSCKRRCRRGHGLRPGKTTGTAFFTSSSQHSSSGTEEGKDSNTLPTDIPSQSGDTILGPCNINTTEAAKNYRINYSATE